MSAYLELPPSHKAEIWSHLLPIGERGERAAFAFVRHVPQATEHRFDFIEWYAVPRSGLAKPNAFQVELTDETKAKVIKRAHDLEACLVELHSHPGPWPAAFSETDRIGLAEFVPHVRWRLRGRPDIALVVAKNDFDGLVWISDAPEAQRLDGIRAGHDVLLPTALSRLGSNA